MNREQRRRAERQRRRHGQRGTSPRSAGPDVLGPIRTEPDRQERSPSSTRGRPSAGTAPSATSTRRPPASVTAASLSASSTGCQAVENTDPQALGLTYTFDAAEHGEPYDMTIAFEGRRAGTTTQPAPHDEFRAIETVTGIQPGSGRITVTTRIGNIAAGDWDVTAGPVLDSRATAPGSRPVPARARTTGRTGFAPLIRVRAPGASTSAWPGLVATGAAVALTAQALLAARTGLPSGPVLLLSLLACLIGVAGARLYYLAEHPSQPRGLMYMSSGMCIQGFVLAAVATVIVGALLLDLPVGTLLDVTTPALLFGMTIGRVGCFFSGCCAGRPTASRWGLWSSDRRLGTRRVPTQLLESAMALAIGVGTLLALLTATPTRGGLVFAGGLAAYTLGRQLLFPLRPQPRNTTHGRSLAMAASAIVLAGAVAVAALS